MSIYIKGMEMPTSCFECRFSIDGFCYASGHVNIRANDERQIANYCPLFPVPPHGKLIDADAVVAEIDNYIDSMAYIYSYLLREEQSQREHGMVFARDIVCDAPTIIPAEEGDG